LRFSASCRSPSITKRQPLRLRDWSSSHPEHELTIYDATYIELALRRNLPLASGDTAMKRAATRAGITLWKP